MSMIIPLLTALLPHAFAESAGTLPAGSDVVYVGVGGATYASIELNEGAAVGEGERDRAYKLRLDGYYAHGLTDRLQLSVWAAPVSAGFVTDTAGLPCPDIGERGGAYEGYCDLTLSAGEVGVQGRYRLTSGAWKVTAGLAALGDPWNAGTRGRYTAVGVGAFGLAPGLYLGRDFELGGRPSGVVAYGNYSWRVGPRLAEGSLAGQTPPDIVGGGLEWRLGLGRWTAQVAVSGGTRLGGLLWDDDFMAQYWPTDERWLVIRDRYLKAEGKASLALSDTSGLHISAGRMLVAVNTSQTLTDAAVGVHKYFP